MSTDNTVSDTTYQDKRAFAGQALERAHEKVRDLGYGMKDIASKGIGTVSESAQAAQRRLENYASATGRYVTEQPLKSALIAAAIGAAVAGIIIALRHNRDR